jgi:phosphoribosylformylglycinamidine synthase
MEVLLGKPPKMHRDAYTVSVLAQAANPAQAGSEDTDGHLLPTRPLPLRDLIYRVVQHPTVADKRFLIHIGDRTVGGLTARDQLVGPWQTAVADCAVTLSDYFGYAGEAFALGERTPLAIANAAASARMAVAEAITNLAAAPIEHISDIKLSANWMAAADVKGQDAALYAAVKAVGMELCPALGIGIPVGKDSMSMRTAWDVHGQKQTVVSPVSLIVSAFARVPDVRRSLTPLLDTRTQDTVLVLVTLNAKTRMGGSIAEQVVNGWSAEVPDVDDAGALKQLFDGVQTLNREGKILAYHDRSDGGLIATLLEMAFASRCGLHVRVQGDDRAVLLNEEVGVVLQLRASDVPRARALFASCAVGTLGSISSTDEIVVECNGDVVLREKRAALHAAWSSVSYYMQLARDNPGGAEDEYDLVFDEGDPGLSPRLTFNVGSTLSQGAHADRPRIAILREQGVNSHVELAAAFTKAGFEAVDVHMSDLFAARRSLREFNALAACGGFSYGDVLGAGSGWAKSILFNEAMREQFAAFFNRDDTLTIGICNGCQMLAQLKPIIPGADHWPRFVRNASEQFEARLSMVEVQPTRSPWFAGMHGSHIPIVVSHGEGFAQFGNEEQLDAAQEFVTLRFVDNYGQMSEAYPSNPNGSPQGITGLCNEDGRITLMMPHPERVHRNVQFSWRPDDWTGEDAPWMQLFYNARKFFD